MSNISNWHRYAIAVLLTIGAVCTALVTGTLAVPPGVEPYLPWLGLVAFAISTLMAFLPRVQTATGVNAPPILSPQDPTKPPRGSP